MSKPVLVVAMYKPKPGKLAELKPLIKEHFPTLKEYGLVTDRAHFLGQSSDGTVLEVFEWASEGAAQKAHQHPAVSKIWEVMATFCDWGKLSELPEASRPFPHFNRFEV